MSFIYNSELWNVKYALKYSTQKYVKDDNEAKNVKKDFILKKYYLQ